MKERHCSYFFSISGWGGGPSSNDEVVDREYIACATTYNRQ